MSDYSVSTINTSVNIPTLTILVVCVNRAGQNIELVSTAAFTHIRDNMPISIGFGFTNDKFSFVLPFAVVFVRYELLVVNAVEFEDILLICLNQTELRLIFTRDANIIFFCMGIPSLITTQGNREIMSSVILRRNCNFTNLLSEAEYSIRRLRKAKAGHSEEKCE